MNTDTFAIELDDDALLECFLNYPDPNEIPYPLDYALIRQHQINDHGMHMNVVQMPQKYVMQQIGQEQLVCYRSHPQRPWRIVIPSTLLDNVIAWYHHVLNHVGMTRLFETIGTHFYHSQLKQRVQDIVGSCDACQRYKAAGQGYGELPPREAPLAPWTEVAVDLIGPWTVNVAGQEIEFNALTCIDPVTNLTELSRIDNKTSEYVGMRFENEWLARYPRPLYCVHDNGSEFIGQGFQRILERNHVKDVPTTVKNPQANAICERMHQTVGNTLRTLCHANPPQDVQQAHNIIESALATASHASRATIHRTMKVSPGGLVFHRDMFLDIPLLANLATIRQNRQRLIDENLRRDNLKRRTHDYQPGQAVLLLVPDPKKLEPRAIGPFPIHQVHTNGTVSILRNPHVLERINIRRIKPYRQLH